MRIDHHLYAEVIYTIIALILEIIVLIPSIEISNIEVVSSFVPIGVQHIIKTIGEGFGSRCAN